MPPETADQLARRLSHATRRRMPRGGPTRTLLGMAGWPVGRELPAAALTRQVDGKDAGQRYWLRADPVYMEVGTNLVLRRWRGLGISDDERQALEPDLASAFREAGLEFSAPVPGRWYLSRDDALDLATTPPDEVGAADAGECLPEGGDPAFWQRLMSEIQIILNNHGVNARRRREGRVPLNSVWFWGGGRLPADLAPEFSSVRGAGALGESLQSIAGQKAGGADVFCLDGTNANAIRAFAGALRSARRVRCLMPWAGREFAWRTRHRLRFWRRRRPLQAWMEMPG